MTKLYVITECEIRDRYEPSYTHVLAIATSTELAVALIQKRHPTLVMEESAVPAAEGEVRFAMRGKGRGYDGDLYFCFEIKPYPVDPQDLGTIEYDGPMEDIEEACPVMFLAAPNPVDEGEAVQLPGALHDRYHSRGWL